MNHSLFNQLQLLSIWIVSVDGKKKSTIQKLRVMFYLADILRTSSLGDSISDNSETAP